MQAEVSEASLGTPGIPPSSLTSFLRVKPAISGECQCLWESQALRVAYANQRTRQHHASADWDAALHV